MKQIRKNIVYIILLLMICLCSGCPENCDDCHDEITIINKTNKDIAFQYSSGSEKRWSFSYYPKDQISTMYFVKADSSSRMYYGGRHTYGGWEGYFKNNDYLNLLFTDEEIFYKYYFELQQPCDTIHKYVPILHQYLLTLEDLQRMNWTVVYPPEDVAINNIGHEFEIYEQVANRRAFMYFNKNVEEFYQTEVKYKANRAAGIERGWDFSENPILDPNWVYSVQSAYSQAQQRHINPARNMNGGAMYNPTTISPYTHSHFNWSVQGGYLNQGIGDDYWKYKRGYNSTSVDRLRVLLSLKKI